MVEWSCCLSCEMIWLVFSVLMVLFIVVKFIGLMKIREIG